MLRYLFLLLPLLLQSQEMRFLYEKSYVAPSSCSEQEMIEHIESSLADALQCKSMLSQVSFDGHLGPKHRSTSNPNFKQLKDVLSIPYFHLLNNLCRKKGISHLHIGLLGGDSFLSALYGNQQLMGAQIGVDWFQECPKKIFFDNCSKYIDLTKTQIIDSGCFAVDKSQIKQSIDLYFYDADHSILAHERAITYYDSVFSNVCTIVIDDWDCPWVRMATFKAFEKMKYNILYETFIPAEKIGGHGQYIALIRKLSK
ncbi:MAG: hypothetical protein MRY21_02460 [Simkaniaceae bacterium]|nr:hypothetical protein [Simkaniaceae bacterium]